MTTHPHLNGAAAPLDANTYLLAEQEYLDGRRDFDSTMAMRREYYRDNPNLATMEVAWATEDARKHQTPIEAAPNPIPVGAIYGTAIDDNANPRGNLARLIQMHGPRLLLALPDQPSQPPDTPADLYGLQANGVLNRTAARSFYEATQTQYLRDAMPPAPDDESGQAEGEGGEAKKPKKRPKPTSSAVYVHAQHCNSTTNWRELCKGAASAVGYWRDRGLDLHGLTVRGKSDANHDLSAIGTPGGIVDLYTGKMLPPAEGLARFITASIPDDYDPSATHEACDAILPPLSALQLGTVEMYRARILALMMTRAPRREMVVEICDSGSGKSTFANALQAAFGPAYITNIPIESLLEPRFKSRIAGEHHGERYALTRPARICFSTESGSVGGKLDADLVKRATGGDPITIRAIREAPESHVASAHLWIQGNITDEGQLELGLAGEDENAEALRDRSKLLPRERIPAADRVPEWVELGYQDTDEARTFRQAVVARIVDYCKAFASLPWPESLPEMDEMLEAQREAERKLWESEWLPYVIAPREGARVTTEAVYASYRYWLDQNEPMTPLKDLKQQKAITARVSRRHKVRASRKRIGDDGRLAQVFDGMVLMIPPGPVSLFHTAFIGPEPRNIG